ncbi:MAG: FAD-dependent monooxygenase [Candidatus Eisenbacteria bacterium]
MELLDGYDVETLVERFGPLPAERAVHLLIQVCHSLAEAHEAGLIHRDIKPANLYVCRYGRDVDFVKVLDFGLVRMPAVASESQLQLTSEQMVPGTPAYLSPEQASGLSPGDARSDLYALGCVAYWMLTGKLVFESAHPLQLLARHIQEEPVPPSGAVRDADSVRARRLGERCLAKNPEQRPQTAVELREALEACPARRPGAKRARMPGGSATRPLRRSSFSPKHRACLIHVLGAGVSLSRPRLFVCHDRFVHSNQEGGEANVRQTQDRGARGRWGPVGLYTAIALRERNVDVDVYDQDPRLAARSYALALHPQSLRLLDEVGLAPAPHGARAARRSDRLLRRAAQACGVLRGDRRSVLYLLVLPQSTFETLLQERLERSRQRVHWSHRVQQLETDEQRIGVMVHKLDHVSLGYPVSIAESTITKSSLVDTQYVIGADGYESRVRNILDIDYQNHGDAGTFFVTEFESDRVIEPELRIVLEGPWANVCWPISEHRVRWSFQIDPREMDKADAGQLVRYIEDRAPWFHPRPREIHWTTLVRFERRLASTFGKGRIWLAGDAAHLTGPVGVQSVNIGLREGHDLASRIANALHNGDEESLNAYDEERRLEWQSLLGITGDIQGRNGVDPWIEQHRYRILPCLPGSGSDLDVMLRQLGLERTAESA